MNLGIYIVNKCTVKFIFADNKYGEFDVEMQQKMTLNNIALTTGDVMTFEDFMSRINKYFVFMYDSPC